MQGQKRLPGAAGARNPKTRRVNVAVAEHINTQIEQVADILGQNKGALASMALSIGLQMLDPRRPVVEVPDDEELATLDV